MLKTDEQIKFQSMVQNALFRQCLAAVPEDQKAEFELSFEIAERIIEVLKSKNCVFRPIPVHQFR